MTNKIITMRSRFLAVSVLLLVCLLLTPFASADDTSTQKVFPSPDAAASALVAADKADDTKSLSSILGPDADQILSSGRSSRR